MKDPSAILLKPPFLSGEDSYSWLEKYPKWAFDGKTYFGGWFWTNGGVLQCRAIGRQLILLAIWRLLTDSQEAGRKSEEDLNNCEKYCRALGRIVGPAEGMTPDQLKLALAKLLFPRESECLEHATRYFGKLDKKYRLGTKPKDTGIGWSVSEDNDLYRYDVKADWLIPTGECRTVVSVNVAFFDDLYERLCGDRKNDPDVGLYFHCLPGEDVKHGDLVISMYYRPNSLSDSQLSVICCDILFGQMHFSLKGSDRD
jgi:hypothetical protein